MKQDIQKFLKIYPSLVLSILMALGIWSYGVVTVKIDEGVTETKEVKKEVTDISRQVFQLTYIMQQNQMITDHSIRRNLDSVLVVIDAIDKQRNIILNVPYVVNSRTEILNDTLLARIEQFIVENKPGKGSYYIKDNAEENKKYDFDYLR